MKSPFQEKKNIETFLNKIIRHVHGVWHTLERALLSRQLFPTYRIDVQMLNYFRFHFVPIFSVTVHLMVHMVWNKAIESDIYEERGNYKWNVMVRVT